jgi:predicted O-methyltransferase YrrM
MIIPFAFEEPVSDPLPLYRVRDGLMAADLLAAAIAHLNLFTWLADHPSTLGAICAHFQIQLRPADVLMTLCAAQGLVTQAGGVFHLTTRAREHLAEGSSFCLKPYYDALKERPQTREFMEILRTDRTANWSSAHQNAWAAAMEDAAFADRFTAAMDCRGVLLGPALARQLDLSGHHALLDVAGGSGIYGCALAACHRHLRVTVYEKPPVDRIAKSAIQQRGYSERVNVQTGDMFVDAFPTGHDVILLSNVLHDWSDETAQKLLEKAADALPVGGLLVVHDAFLNPEKNGPLPVAQYSALLMHSTEGRCFSTAEMRKWAESAGLEWKGHSPTAVDRSYLLFEKN